MSNGNVYAARGDSTCNSAIWRFAVATASSFFIAIPSARTNVTSFMPRRLHRVPAKPRQGFREDSESYEFWFPLSHRWIDDSSHSMRPR